MCCYDIVGSRTPKIGDTVEKIWFSKVLGD
jgi:hypothetical protein